MVSTVLRRRAVVANNPIFFSSIPTFLFSKQWSASNSRLGNLRSIYSTSIGGDSTNKVHMDPIFRAGFEIDSRLISFETVGTSFTCGDRFANGASLMTMEGTKVLSAVNSASCLMNRDLQGSAALGCDHAGIPVLNVDYEEDKFNVFMNDHYLYEQNNIVHEDLSDSKNRTKLKMKRDGARIIDRAIRPLFPAGLSQEIHVRARVISTDGDQDPVVMAANATSAALMLSDIPWDGPIGVVRVGRGRRGLIINPSMEQIVRESDLNLIYACTQDKTLMIDVQAYQISEEDLKTALRVAHCEAVKYLEPQIKLAAKAGRRKNIKDSYKLFMVTEKTLEKVKSLAEASIEAVFSSECSAPYERDEGLNKVKQDVERELEEECDQESLKFVGKAVDNVMKSVLRRKIIQEGLRVDGRGIDEVRSLHCEILEKHSSSRFSLGDTTVECSVTLDTASWANNYLSVNDSYGSNTDFVENALLAALPRYGSPYGGVIVRSKFGGYNCDHNKLDGSSTCMATICGTCLAIRDVDNSIIMDDVAGVSMGLVSEVDPSTGTIKNYRILTDTCGSEECQDLELGDMNMKIAGTRKGVTAIQLSMISQNGIPLDIICECLEPALKARLQIIDCMERLSHNFHSKSISNSKSSFRPEPCSFTYNW